MKFRVQQILDAVSGERIQGDVQKIIRGVSIDSRSVKKGELFIAIKGERFDGHDFVLKAIEKGAVAVVLSRPMECPSDIPIIFVQNTTHALGQMARFYRRQFAIPVIAVTGSAGKTTAKEMIAAVLSQRYKVLKNPKTENNQFGVPLTLLQLRSSHDAAVLELGTNHPGEIAYLSQIVEPTIAVFTNIGASHLEGLKSIAGVFREKAQMLKYTASNGTVIFNRDDRFLKALVRKKIPQKKCSYGVKLKADFQATSIIAMSNQKLQFQNHQKTFSLNTAVEHNVLNALAAMACGRLLRVPWEEIQKAFQQFRFRDSRQVMERTRGLWLIDDTYNANPLSFQSAIRTLNGLKVHGKKILVCADMLELGKQSKFLHEQLARAILKSGIDWVLATGKEAKWITDSLQQTNGHRIRSVFDANLNHIHQRLKEICKPGDAVLVKGSRGMQMERTVEFLRNFGTDTMLEAK